MSLEIKLSKRKMMQRLNELGSCLSNGYQSDFRKEFPELSKLEHEQLTLKYVNLKTNELDIDYYVPKGNYTSLADVHQAFDDAFEASKKKSRWYFIGTNRHCDDMAMKYLHRYDVQYQKEHRSEYYFEKFVGMPDPMGVNQDRMIASATVMSFPEYQRNYKVLQFMNLDLSYVVAHPITVEQSLLKQLQTDVNVVKKRRAINLDLKFGDLIEKSKSDCQSETQFD